MKFQNKHRMDAEALKYVSEEIIVRGMVAGILDKMTIEELTKLFHIHKIDPENTGSDAGNHDPEYLALLRKDNLVEYRAEITVNF